MNAEHAADDRDDIAGEIGGIGMQHIISVIEQHGLLVVFLNVLLAQSGLPLPAFPTLMAAGALVTQSRYHEPFGADLNHPSISSLVIFPIPFLCRWVAAGDERVHWFAYGVRTRASARRIA